MSEIKNTNGIREFTSPADDIEAMMTKKCEQCGIIGLHLCSSVYEKPSKTGTDYCACIRALEKSLADSERDLEGARRGLRMMTEERDALLATAAQSVVIDIPRRIKIAGANMANTMFNLAQGDIGKELSISFKEMQTEWDAAIRDTNLSEKNS